MAKRKNPVHSGQAKLPTAKAGEAYQSSSAEESLETHGALE